MIFLLSLEGLSSILRVYAVTPNFSHPAEGLVLPKYCALALMKRPMERTA
jgi:hypothetical protein